MTFTRRSLHLIAFAALSSTVVPALAQTAHPEIRWRTSKEDLAGFVETQLGMLKAAAGHVAPGGALAYSTCTVTREENAGVVKAFLESEEGAGFTLDQLCGRNCLATRLAPGSSDAHFAVRFVRKPQE